MIYGNYCAIIVIKDMNILGIDIGATKIFFLARNRKKIIWQKKIATPATKKEFERKLLLETESAIKKLKIKKIGVAAAGFLDRKNGKIIFSPNIKELNGLPLKKIIGKVFQGEIVIENDGNCFALAEAKIGAGRKNKNVFGITLGSGVGGGFVVNGKIYYGNSGKAMEIGHLPIKFDGYKCSCGNSGCFEEYASKKYFDRLGVNPEELAKEKTARARKVFSEFGKNLAVGISGIINIIDPEVIIIGGGIANNYSLFSKPMMLEIKKRNLPPKAKITKIKKSLLGEKSVAAGATFLFNG